MFTLQSLLPLGLQDLVVGIFVDWSSLELPGGDTALKPDMVSYFLKIQ